MHFFLEEKALNDQGELAVPKARAVNKIGHGAQNFFLPFSPNIRTTNASPPTINTNH